MKIRQLLLGILLLTAMAVNLQSAFAWPGRGEPQDGRREEMGSYQDRRQMNRDDWRRQRDERDDRREQRERMSPDERREFRRSIEDAGRDLYRRR